MTRFNEGDGSYVSLHYSQTVVCALTIVCCIIYLKVQLKKKIGKKEIKFGYKTKMA